MFLKRKICFSMIPYTSGNIHLGHMRNYIINNIYNNINMIYNFNIEMPIGWDSFGTPAENASFLKNLKPYKFTKKNIIYMTKQLRLLNLSINWKNSFKTFYYKYYYINQLILNKFLSKKLLYISNKKINWDPCDKTVLSDEQVINNRGWRSRCLINKKNIKTYYINIILYKFEIYKELDNLDWPQDIKLMQKRWILKKFFIFFLLFFFFNLYFFKKEALKNLYFYIFFHFIRFLVNNFKIFNSTFYVLNNFKIKFELWFFKFKNYFFNYLKKFFKIFTFNNIIFFIYSFFKGFYIFEVFFFLKKKINFEKNFWNLKNWGVSRQRYWGSQIPSFNCCFCKKKFLFNNKSFIFFISKNLKFINNFFYFNYFNKIKCLFCKKNYLKENNTIDTFFDSSWYYLKYFHNKNIINFNMPINCYIGGKEHCNLHLLYTRFFIKFLRDLKYLNFGEPIKRYFYQGLILSKEKSGEVSKMSKSKGNIITPENVIIKFNIYLLKVFILKISLDKDFFWPSSNIAGILFSYNNNLKLFLNNNKKKNKNFNIFYDIKIFFYFFYENLKKIFYFFSEIKLYNNCINFFIKILKYYNFFRKKLNYFLKNIIIFNILKNLYIFIPLFCEKLWFFFKFFKFNKSFFFKKKYYFKKYFKYKKFYLLLNNKKICNIYFINFISKKKVINLLFFKKKIKKGNFKCIQKIRFILNIRPALVF